MPLVGVNLVWKIVQHDFLERAPVFTCYIAYGERSPEPIF